MEYLKRACGTRRFIYNWGREQWEKQYQAYKQEQEAVPETERILTPPNATALKKQFNATLPRFDVMAALYRKPDGMLMSEIARFLIVSNGNVTGIVDRLVAEGFVARSQRDGDRRTSFITLTRRGRAAFAAMAAAHEGWIDELLDGVSARDAEQLSAKLKSFRSEWEAEA